MEELRISDASSGEESVPPKRKTAYKKKRRALSSTTPTESDAEGCTGKETANCIAEARPQSPPPARKANRLPTDEKRLAELRHAPSANLAVNILEVADSIEQMASTAKNLKGTYIRRMREGTCERDRIGQENHCVRPATGARTGKPPAQIATAKGRGRDSRIKKGEVTTPNRQNGRK